MVVGIAIIGKELTMKGFQAIRESHRFPRGEFLFIKPVESAYPFSLNSIEQEPSKRYIEGILTCVTTLKSPEVTDLKASLAAWIIEVSKQLEKDYCDAHQNGRQWAHDSNVPYDFPAHHHQLATANLGDGPGLVYTAHYELLKTCPEERLQEEYLLIAPGMVTRTREARIKRFRERQESHTEAALRQIMEREHYRIL
jgi:hypothetical protein